MELESASLLKDLHTASPPVRSAVSWGVAAFGAYFTWFGALAIGGVWRGSLLSPLQIGVVVAALALQGLIGWALKIKPMPAGLIWSALWLIPSALFVMASATANDYRDVALFILSPIVLCLLFAFYFGKMAGALNIPMRRGD